MTLADAILKFQARFDEVSGEIGYPPDVEMDLRDWSRAPTGNEYLTMVAFASEQEAAVELWLAGVQRKFPPNRTLFWRVRPEVDQDVGEWRVYSRLATAA